LVQAGGVLSGANLAREVHPLRPPAFSPGFTSFLWGLGLGLFIWIGLLAVGVSSATAFLVAVVSGVLIFFYVRLYGADPLRR
jgi:hypothetical protein